MVLELGVLAVLPHSLAQSSNKKHQIHGFHGFHHQHPHFKNCSSNPVFITKFFLCLLISAESRLNEHMPVFPGGGTSLEVLQPE